MATKKPTAKAAGKKEARPTEAPDPEKSEAMARFAVRPSVNAAAVLVSYSKPLGIEQHDFGALMDQLAGDMEDVWAGDLKRAESMLFGQAHALQSIFMELARRAATQEYLKQWEAYLRMALKAQSQCRMTLETLATIKNPPVVIARQANINNGGQQQVNNGMPQTKADSGSIAAHACAANSHAAPTELLGTNDVQRLDAGAASAAGRADQVLAPVGAINRAKDGHG